jgi:hypothetical protein
MQNFISYVSSRIKVIFNIIISLINIMTDLREIICEVVDWMHLAQDRDQWQPVVNTVMNLRGP